MRAIPQAVVDLIKNEEKCCLFVYDDGKRARPVVPGDKIIGVLTGGYGHTGDDVSAYLHVNQDLADAWLIDDLEKAARDLQDKVGVELIKLLTENQYASLIDFVYNCGVGKKNKPEWTIWKRLRAKQFDQVPLELAKFVNDVRPDGTVVKLQHLVERRNTEIALWAKDEPGTHTETPPSSKTRETIADPTPSDPVPITKSKSFIAGSIGALTGAPVMVDSMTHAIEPFAKHSAYVERMLGTLALIGAVCVAITMIYMYIQKRNARN